MPAINFHAQFADVAAFFEWFRANHGKTMSGYLIRWN